MKTATLTLLLGSASAGVIPLTKRDLKAEHLNARISGLKEGLTGAKTNVKNYQNTEYLLDVTIGTPAQAFVGVPDTATAKTLVYSNDCWSYACWNVPDYAHGSSSTYTADGKAVSLAFEGKTMTGVVSEDLVRAGGASSTFKFAEMTSVPSSVFLDVADKPTAVLGLGFPESSSDAMGSFLGNMEGSDKSFSLYLHTDSTQSYMMLPGMDTANWRVIDTHRTRPGSWALDIDYVQQGNGQWVNAQAYSVTLDSSEALIYGPSKLFKGLTSGLSIETDCSNIESLPSLTFGLAGVPYTLTAQDYVIKTAENTCSMGLHGVDNYKGVTLGAPFLRKYPVWFNYEASTISFLAPKSQQAIEGKINLQEI